MTPSWRTGLAAANRRWHDRRRLSVRARVIAAVGVCALIVGLVGLVAHYRAPSSSPLVAISALSPYFGFGALLATALFAATRGVVRALGAACSVAVLVWYVALQAPLYVAQTASASGPHVVVMTANLYLGQADPASVVATARAHGVGLLMLEEITPAEVAALRKAGLDDLLPHSVVGLGPIAAGVGLWSRYPLNNTVERHDFGLSMVTARAAIPGVAHEPFVIALHMFAPTPSSEFPQWERDLSHLHQLLTTLQAYPTVLVGGDFNSTPDVPQFRRLLVGGYADAADQAGAGYTRTYPANQWYPPLIAIDHVLTRGADATEVQTVHIARSDHRGVVAQLRLDSPTRSVGAIGPIR